MKNKYYHLIRAILVLIMAVSLVAFMWTNAEASENAISKLPAGNVQSLMSLNDGRLMAISILGEDKPNEQDRIKTFDAIASYSDNSGQGWAEPQVIISHGEDWGVLSARTIYSQDVIYMAVCQFRGLYTDSKIYMTKSEDSGLTWSEMVKVNTGYDYNYMSANGIVMRDGTLVFSFAGGPRDGHWYFQSGILTSSDNGDTWSVSNMIDFPSPVGVGMDEPSIVELVDGSIMAVCRTSRGYSYYSVSSDKGQTWTDPLDTGLISPVSPTTIFRLSFEPDKIIAIWNYARIERKPLAIAQSLDSGKTWSNPVLVNPEISCYAVAENAPDGNLYIAWGDNIIEIAQDYIVNGGEIASLNMYDPNYVAPSGGGGGGPTPLTQDAIVRAFQETEKAKCVSYLKWMRVYIDGKVDLMLAIKKGIGSCWLIPLGVTPEEYETRKAALNASEV